jgi:hypothetical protein
MDYGNLKVPENVTPEVQAILDSYEARNKEIENAHRKNTGRIWLGSAISGLSAHPVLNVPYVGTGLGGALYELGQGITEGDKLPELAKRTGAGFAIGETVGAIPYAGKYANKLSGGKIGNALTAGVEKLASTPLGQKVAEIAPKVEDLLMTDIKAFNPNKQTVYHGSPYDFAKFSNEAIGTGEGAQAHGYGHYVALDKDVADIRYRQALTGDDFDNMQYFYNGKKIEDKREKAILATILENGKENVVKVREKNLPRYKYDEKEYKQKLKELDFVKNINENLIKKDTDKGQLYKLSIPKDDVMLREDLPFNQQPLKVQEALKNLGKTYNDLFDNNEIITNIEYFPNTTRGKDIYGSLMRDLGDKVAVSDELYHNGIKGISYNGGIDGEARVIFNPDDIKIVRKYYNQPSLYEQIKKQKPFYGGVSNALYDYITGE